MLLALAVLLIQPSFLTNDAVANVKLQQSVGQSSLPSTPQSTQPTSDKGAQKSAPAPTGEPVFPAMSAAKPQQNTQAGEASYAPGQIELTRVNPTTDESSSRATSGPGANGAASSFTPTPFTPMREAGRAHGMPRTWMILSGISHGAATFDAYSTRRVIKSGTGVELNPMLKPFANSNVLYGAVQVAPAIFDFVGLRMMRSQHGWVRRLWWLPQSASAAASMFGGVHNSMMH